MAIAATVHCTGGTRGRTSFQPVLPGRFFPVFRETGVSTAPRHGFPLAIAMTAPASREGRGRSAQRGRGGGCRGSVRVCHRCEARAGWGLPEGSAPCREGTKARYGPFVWNHCTGIRGTANSLLGCCARPHRSIPGVKMSEVLRPGAPALPGRASPGAFGTCRFVPNARHREAGGRMIPAIAPRFALPEAPLRWFLEKGMRWGAHTRILREPGEISLVVVECWCRGAPCVPGGAPRWNPCIADGCVDGCGDR